jgi:hypothetical protein
MIRCINNKKRLLITNIQPQLTSQNAQHIAKHTTPQTQNTQNAQNAQHTTQGWIGRHGIIFHEVGEEDEAK